MSPLSEVVCWQCRLSIPRPDSQFVFRYIEQLTQKFFLLCSADIRYLSNPCKRIKTSKKKWMCHQQFVIPCYGWCLLMYILKCPTSLSASEKMAVDMTLGKVQTITEPVWCFPHCENRVAKCFRISCVCVSTAQCCKQRGSSMCNAPQQCSMKFH